MQTITLRPMSERPEKGRRILAKIQYSLLCWDSGLFDALEEPAYKGWLYADEIFFTVRGE